MYYKIIKKDILMSDIAAKSLNTKLLLVMLSDLLLAIQTAT